MFEKLRDFFSDYKPWAQGFLVVFLVVVLLLGGGYYCETKKIQKNIKDDTVEVLKP